MSSRSPQRTPRWMAIPELLTSWRSSTRNFRPFEVTISLDPRTGLGSGETIWTSRERPEVAITWRWHEDSSAMVECTGAHTVYSNLQLVDVNGKRIDQALFQQEVLRVIEQIDWKPSVVAQLASYKSRRMN